MNTHIHFQLPLWKLKRSSLVSFQNIFLWNDLKMGKLKKRLLRRHRYSRCKKSMRWQSTNVAKQVIFRLITKSLNFLKFVIHSKMATKSFFKSWSIDKFVLACFWKFNHARHFEIPYGCKTKVSECLPKIYLTFLKKKVRNFTKLIIFFLNYAPIF